MAKSKGRAKAIAKKKGYRKSQEGKMSPKGRRRFIKKNAKEFRDFIQKNKDNIMSHEEAGLPEEVTFEDLKKLKDE